jgi:hypothetical protein
MWLIEMVVGLTPGQMLNLLSAALCVALAAGLNDRTGAWLSAILCLLAVFA